MDKQFESLTKDIKKSFIADFSEDSKVLLVAFGGVGGELSIPAFEFFNLTRGFPVKKIFIRDLKQVWYACGVPELGNSIEEVAASLAQYRDREGVKKVILVGNSMGGYAALLFGWLIQADIVHAFCPQTYINQKLRFLHFDSRWKSYLKKMYRNKEVKNTYFDLKKVFTLELKKTLFYIHYTKGDRIDRIHAQRMAKFPGVVLCGYEGSDHWMVHSLKKTGTLKKILTKSLAI